MPIGALESILKEKRNLNASVLEEAGQKLLQQMEFSHFQTSVCLSKQNVSLKIVVQVIHRSYPKRIINSVVDKLCYWRRCLHNVLECVKVVDGHLKELIWRATRDHLILKTHGHEIVQLRKSC